MMRNAAPPFCLLALLLLTSPANAVIDCQATKGVGDRWAWRSIEPHPHRKCWYPGGVLIPKSQLRWSSSVTDPHSNRVHRRPTSKRKPIEQPNEMDLQADTKGPTVIYPTLMPGGGVDPMFLFVHSMSGWPVLLDIDMSAQFTQWNLRVAGQFK